MKIVYKIGVALLALGVLAVAVFTPFVKIIVTSDIASFLSKETNVVLDKAYSIKQLAELYVENKDVLSQAGFSLKSIPENVVSALRVPAIAFIVLLVLALLCAVLLVFFGLFAKKMRGPVVLAILGAASAYGMNIAFNSLAKPLLKGTVSVTDILGQELITGLTGGVSVLGDILSAFTGGTSQLVNIKLFALGGAYVFMILLFVAVIVWTIFYAFADWDKQ